MRKFRTIQGIMIILLFISSIIQAQNKKDCAYSKNSIDEFTKERDVRTKSEEIYYKKEIAPPGTSGSLWCKVMINVSACNIGGENCLLFFISKCNCESNDLTSISLLLENGDVIHLNNKIKMDYQGDCQNYFQFYSPSDSIWLKIKTLSLKKIKITDYNNRQQIFEIEEKNMGKIMNAIKCIDLLEIKQENK